MGFQNHHKVYGNISRPHKYIRDNPQFVNKNHEMRIQFLDIETRAVNGFAKPETAEEEISLIQTYDSVLKKFVIFGTQEYDNHYKSELGEVIYKKCENEVEMLKKYLIFLDKTNPAIISGFNSNLFDLPYLAHRLPKVGLDYADLSPIKKVTFDERRTPDGLVYRNVDIKGVLQLDLRNLYMKYATQKPSRYSLDEISLVEGIGRKVEYDGSIEDLYKDYQKFVEYGIRDVELLILLEQKLKLIKVCCLVAYTCGVNADEVSGTYVQWGALMFNTALKKGKILPFKQLNIVKTAVPYPGGWVRATEGLHKNVCSYDFTSLYPNIITEFKVGLDNFIYSEYPPLSKLKQLEKNRAEHDGDAYVEPTKRVLPEPLKNMLEKYFYLYSSTYDKSDNDSNDEFLYFKNIIENRDEIRAICKRYGVVVTPNGCLYFENGESIFSELISNFFIERVKTKTKMKSETDKVVLDALDLLQYMFKILMNAAYGTTALDTNPFSFGRKMAESITTTGRFLNMWVSYRVNEFCKKKYNLDIDLTKRNISVQCDTDSNYFEFKFLDAPTNLVENAKFLRDYCEKTISPVIEKAILEAVTSLTGRATNKHLGMEQETVMDRMISCASKRYVGRYPKGEKTSYKITGLPMIDKTTCKWTKARLYECLDYILDEKVDLLRDFVKKIENDFSSQPLDTILTNKSVSNLKYFKKPDGKWTNTEGQACPLQSRGSINFNNLVKSKNLNLDLIKEGQKIYICYLKEDNPYTNDNCICVPDIKIFSEVPNLVNYIDFKTLFNKNFVQKLDIMSKHIGYDYNNTFSSALNDWI